MWLDFTLLPADQEVCPGKGFQKLQLGLCLVFLSRVPGEKKNHRSGVLVPQCVRREKVPAIAFLVQRTPHSRKVDKLKQEKAK